ncbi:MULTISPECIES: DoxX family membrane protein [Arenibacter]|uniref:DoxX family membrane protein n=1 Tax=Arenibacter TaxID=178469 RepID=UPI001C06740D|nr:MULTISPECIES: DoxX family membrane protein [Arenibacter]MBU2903391.1 DoxX family membrane protein [Arenibacter algicola]MCK0136520.1 DoxX family membrane protein [Arenibacter sp. S6351L]
MNSTFFIALRFVFGIFLIVFGANKFLHFMPAGQMSEAAMNYFSALMSTNTLYVVAIVEILSGLSLLTNKFGALMMIILMTVSVNALLFNAFLEPGSIGLTLVLLVLNIVMLYAYKERYKDILRP